MSVTDIVSTHVHVAAEYADAQAPSDSVGDPPQDILTLFGERIITEGEDTRCWTAPRRGVTCATPANDTVIVLVTSAIA